MPKRPREESDEDSGNGSEEEGELDAALPSYQALPVADLPDNFQGEPQDGMEYLFLVRRDAKSLPEITTAHNPYVLPEAEPLHKTKRILHAEFPTEGWRTSFESKFKNMRDMVRMSKRVESGGIQRKDLPRERDREGWWTFIRGTISSEHPRPERTPSPDQSICSSSDSAKVPPTPRATPPNLYSPREPTPSLMRLLDQKMMLRLIMFFGHWINLRLTTMIPNTSASNVKTPTPKEPITDVHIRWIFSLLVYLDGQLTSDDISHLRIVARASMGLIKDRLDSGSHVEVGIAGCWMLIAAVAGVWGQKDLWTDAEEMFSKDH